MKKIILDLVFVFATGTTLINATSTNDEILPATKEAIEVVEEFSCLTDAYNATNKIESNSVGGSYSWDIETWSNFFNQFFEICNNGYDVDELANIMID